MEIFCKDTKLNLSPYYMKPGFAFGGSCLPKDVRALTYKAKSLDLQLPLLSSLMPSNQLQVQKGFDMITAYGRKRVGILGFAFKAGTDDLRESPLVEVIESLIGKGYDLRLFDRNVNLAALTGANRDYILNHIPHISKLMVESMADVLAFAEVIVIGNSAPEFRTILEQIKPHQIVVDLVRIVPNKSDAGRYDGICW
jgi:GDP-mannose 6-dehydrogenase